MRAIRQHAFGGPQVLRLEEVPDPRPAAGQVRIRVQSAGVHLIDTVIRLGEASGPYPMPELPMTPGREVAGVVDEVGGGVDESLLGRLVAADLGMAGGGYAEFALAAADSLHVLPGGAKRRSGGSDDRNGTNRHGHSRSRRPDRGRRGCSHRSGGRYRHTPPPGD